MKYIIAIATMLSLTSYAEIAERIVAVVNDEVITLLDVDRAMAPYLDEIKSSQDKEGRFKGARREVIDQLVDDALLRQAIKRAKIEITDDELARAIKNVLKQNNITIDVLKAELARRGVSFDTYKEELRQELGRLKFVNQEIGSKINLRDQDLKDYFLTHLNEFGMSQSVHIAQIILPFTPETRLEDVEGLRSKARQIVKSARAGTSFAALAKEHSKGPNIDKGGDLGVLDPRDLIGEIRGALVNMRPGDISDPVISPFGVHIVKLIDRGQVSREDFDRLKEQIYNQMYDQRVKVELKQYLSEARKRAYVEIKE